MSTSPTTDFRLLRTIRYGSVVAGFDVAAGLLAQVVASGHEWTSLNLVLGLLCIFAAGGYRSRLVLHSLDDWPASTLAVLGGSSLAAFVRSLSDLPISVESGMTFTLCWIAAMLPARKIAYLVIGRIRTSRLVAHRTLLVGSGPSLPALAADLQKHPKYGLLPVGIVSPLGSPWASVPRAGALADIGDLIDSYQADTVIVESAGLTRDQSVTTVRECDRLDVVVYLIPDTAEVIAGLTRQHVRGIPLLRLPRRAYHTLQWRVKRLMDLCASGLALGLLGPLLLVIIALIKRETGASWLFRQVRVGIDGESFELLKIQTMKPAVTSDTEWRNQDESRIGPFGKILRASSIDELPQLLNIWRGDMSLVGPRPERPHFVAEFEDRYPRYVARHRVPCGLTGLAQVSGLRGDTSIEERVRYDNLYIERWSLWLDVKIMLRTVPQVIFGGGG